MKRFLFLLLFLIPVIGTSVLWSAILNVGAGQTYTSIQAAVNAASDGDEIRIAIGTYNEALSVGKSLLFNGEGADWQTVITSTTANVVTLTAANKDYRFQNLTIQGGGANDGIKAGSTVNINSFMMLNSIVQNCRVGIYCSEYYSGGAFQPATINYFYMYNVIVQNNTYIGAYIGKAVADGTVTDCTFQHNGFSDLEPASWQKCGLQFIDFNGSVVPHVQVTNSVFNDNGAGASDIERTGIAVYTATSTYSATDILTVSGCTFTNHPQYAVRIKNAYNVGNTATVNGTFSSNWLDIWFNNIIGSTTSTTSVRNTFTGIRDVGPGPTHYYNTIQAAIDAAAPGDLIQVAAGTYNENINVNNRVSIVGAGSGSDPLTNTIITQTAAGVGSPYRIGVVQLNASGLSSADPILFQNLRILPNGISGFSVGEFYQSTGTVVSYLKFDNVKVIGTNTNPSSEQERGLYVDNTSSASYLEFVNCSFDNLTYGWYFQKAVSADASTVTQVSVTNTTFIHNNHKGLYAEKLDNTTFTDCTVSENGYDSSVLPPYFAPWCCGVDVNLKAGTYTNLVFDGCIITSNGIGNSKEGAGLALKARDDGTSYGLYPATLTGVTIVDCTITGNERGVRFGEPGKNNATPANVTITDCNIGNNTQHYTGIDGSIYGDVINMTANSASIVVYGVTMVAGQSLVTNVHNTIKETYHYSIQSAVDAADPGDVIEIGSGTYIEQLHVNIENLTLQGVEFRDPVVIQSPAVLPLSFSSGTNNNKPVVFVEGVQDFTLNNVTVDGNYQGNANYRFNGVGFYNAGGTLEDVDVINIMDNPFSGAQHGVAIYAYNDISANTYEITLNSVDILDFQKNGVALIGNSATSNLVVNINDVTAVGQGPTNVTAQNGIQVNYASGSITNCEVTSVEWLGGTWGASGILPQYTTDLEISNNVLTGCQVSVYAYGSTNLTVENNIISGAATTAILDYSGVDSEITLNDITDSAYGIWAYLTDGADITGNGIEGSEIALILDGLDHTVTGNSFVDNNIHVYNDNTIPVDMDAMLLANTFDNAVIVDQAIYGNAGLIYVTAPSELIDAGETQTYSVICQYVEHLRGFTVQVKIPKEDFEFEPTNFLLGTLFDSPLLMTTAHDADYWVYNVSGAKMGGVAGISGDQVVLFTFEATSTGGTYANTPDGCYIEVPLTEVILKNDENPYEIIVCEGTVDMLVLIDGVLPTITIDNITFFNDGMTLPIDPALTVANGYPSVAVPPLSLDYWDNYNLDYSQYMLVAYGSEPTSVAEFLGSTYLFGPDYTDATYDNLIWDDPDTDLNAALNDLPNGHYTLSFLAVDDAGNFVIVNWSFYIDKTAPGPIVWDSTIPCRTTINSNNSIDLKWANPDGTVKNHIWILSYGDIGTNTPYPEYEDHSEPTIPAAPNPYNPAVQNGWTRNVLVDPVPATFPYAITGMARGYYYVTIFAEDINGNISEAPVSPFYRASISYWPGDVDATAGTVLAGDISMLTAKWGLTAASTEWNPIIDVGPSTDYARRSRPTPDDVIDIEDLMMFAMNYNNTVYTWYPRGNEAPEVDPIGIELIARLESDVLYVDVNLSGNTDAVKGLNVPFAYGSGLRLQTVALGEIWPEGSVILHTDRDNILEISMSAMGYDSVIQGNGTVATAAFRILGSDTALQLRHMKARTMDNRDIVIEDNPTDMTTDNDDLVNVIPAVNYLGTNFPNPFRSETTVQYGLKAAGSVKISVYNSRGQLVRTLVNDSKAAGTYQTIWNGRDSFDRPVSSGVYFFRMESGEEIQTTKGLMIK